MAKRNDDPTFWYNQVIRSTITWTKELGEYFFPVAQLSGREDFALSLFKADLRADFNTQGRAYSIIKSTTTVY